MIGYKYVFFLKLNIYFLFFIVDELMKLFIFFLMYNWNFGFRINLIDLETIEFAFLSAKLEGVPFYLTRGDVRLWILESDGSCSCKSYRSYLCNNPEFSDFDPTDQIWKSKVPSKVHLLAELAAHGKVNTCNNIQYLNPHWCILCTATEECRPFIPSLFLLNSNLVEIFQGVWCKLGCS